MSYDRARDLFNEADTNHDGKIDRKEFSKWAKNTVDEGVPSSLTSTSGGYFSRGSYGGADIRTDVSYDTDAHAVFDRTDLNRNHIIEQRVHNQYDSDENIVGGTSSSENYVSRYSTDGRGFYLDPHPEIITRKYTGPAPTYTQTITIRYLQPPPLPPVGENIIREVRAPPLPAPPPLIIREPGKPGFQSPPLVLRERPPAPPPVTRGIEKTVIVAPLPAPPRSTIIEKFPDLPDRPRDIILERWLPYEPRPPGRTVRIAAVTGPIPAPIRNQIIQYQTLEPRVVRQFQRFGVTRADPEVYVREFGNSLLDSGTFIQQARAVGVVEDISVPAGTAIRYATSTDGYGDVATGSYTGGANEYITTGSTKYSGGLGSYTGGANDYSTTGSTKYSGGLGSYTGGANDYSTTGSTKYSGALGSYTGGANEYSTTGSTKYSGALGSYTGDANEYSTTGSTKYSGVLGSDTVYTGITSSEYATNGSGFSRESDAVDTAFRLADTNNDGVISADEFDRFVDKVNK